MHARLLVVRDALPQVIHLLHARFQDTQCAAYLLEAVILVAEELEVLATEGRRVEGLGKRGDSFAYLGGTRDKIVNGYTTDRLEET